jgi:hypothetical protein
MLTNTTLPFDYEYNPTAAFNNAFAASFVAAWFLGLLTFVSYYGNHRPAVPTATKGYKRAAVSSWMPVATLEFDGRQETLYERTYPSGKKAWRYQEAGAWAYPRRSELDLSAIA